MPQYLLSPQAQKSLIQISNYTVKQYGQRQKKAYLNMLRKQMCRAAKTPTLGQKRDDLKAGYYSIKAEKHTIYYRIQETHIEVIDVLHQSMEPMRHIR